MNSSKKNIKPPLIPDSNTVYFKPDANVEEVFGLSKPKENLDQPLTDEQQKPFDKWDWIAEDQELPEPDPVKLAKYKKKMGKKKKTVNKKLGTSSTNSRSMVESGSTSLSMNLNLGILESSGNSDENVVKKKGNLTERINNGHE